MTARRPHASETFYLSGPTEPEFLDEEVVEGSEEYSDPEASYLRVCPPFSETCTEALVSSLFFKK